MVPVIYSDSSAGVAARIIEEMTGRFSGPEGISLPAVLFSSVLNPREYQLLEIETGRQSPLMTLGYIPGTLERNAPELLEMCLPDSSAKISLQVKTAAAQLGASAGQVDWNILWGVARFHDEWTENPEPLKGKCADISVGIIDHEALRLEGDNARQLFSMLGCSVKMLELQSRGGPELNALYVPHGPGFLLAEHLLGNADIKEWFRSFFRSRRGIFVNGGVTPLLGKSFSLPNDRQYEGMGIFPFRGKFEMPSPGIRRVEISSREGDAVLNMGEKMRGHMPSCCSVFNLEDEAPSLWTLQEPNKTKNFGLSGWNRGKGIATEVCIQPWSNIEGMGRWLAFCKS
jgi:cobyrinic acid a,c-diamide synthase